MKVLMITRTLAEFANQQGKIREIAKQGINLTVVSPPRWAGSDREVRRVKPDGYKFQLHPCWFSGTNLVRLGNHCHLYSGIASLIAGDKWDLVHIDEEPFNLATFHALRGCCRYGVKAVFSTWQNLMKTYPPPFNLFERYVFDNVAGAIAGNQAALDMLRRKGFCKLATRIPLLGVDPIMFRRQNSSELRKKLDVDSSFVVGFIGRIHIQKGLDTLVRAFATLPKSSVLVLVGRGSYRARLERLIEALGLSKRVRWLPWVHSHEVPEYVNAFDALVLPSRTRWNCKEQFGRVLVEAMACEICVVGSDSGEIPNVIGDAGLVFHEGDERQLAECLRNLMDSTSLRETLARLGRHRVLQNFTYAKIAEDLVHFYRQVCFGANEPVKCNERNSYVRVDV